MPGVGERNLALRRTSWGASVAPPSTLEAMAETFPAVVVRDALPRNAAGKVQKFRLRNERTR